MVKSMKNAGSGPLFLRSLNHISLLCRSLEDSTEFMNFTIFLSYAGSPTCTIIALAIAMLFTLAMLLLFWRLLLNSEKE